MSDLVDRIMQEIRGRREALDNRQATAERAAWANSPWWRAGRKVGRTVYARIAQGGDLDPLIGCMDSAVCVEHIVLNDPNSVLADISRQRAMLDWVLRVVERHGESAYYASTWNCPACDHHIPCPDLLDVATALGITD